ncbi:Cys-tRNA(Pro) deacylase [Desulfoprunum benzoelyticum]|uniref:Cys-tRNA(Pro)/Cys-tRNA(Cys) deacylase n=1 Tax=Desulfoprunum benzoelyticum TaxID=1506996 RepID=A0A840V5Z5_9BACT|nr:Cys-tRNA(Pro) deacylase [Desulfoprunum benzoelyticum]MBB5348461.1 Cys-tRNA(Pro)/Cys-tRNA(Cys) deacylase [Desulfoprunum benzoelyticum]MBM9530204.1 Cys-tRNA(Pro) deacylase [Desulfoprunum benzoelyticum]
MTPAINAARKARIRYTIHQYPHDPAADSYGLEAAEKLGVPAAQVFKTLVVSLDDALAVAVVPVSAMLSMKRFARAAGAKKADMAAAAEVERATGYVLGGVSPLGQKKRLQIIVDASAQSLATVFVSAGRRGLSLELRPTDLQGMTGATFAAICRHER